MAAATGGWGRRPGSAWATTGGRRSRRGTSGASVVDGKNPRSDVLASAPEALDDRVALGPRESLG
eukprot:14391833-Alexandrium_andersonii.AAC.1